MSETEAGSVRRLRAEKENERLQHLQEAERLRAIVASLDAVLALIDQAESGSRDLNLDHPGSQRIKRQDTVKARVERAVREARGRPIHANEILHALQAEGVRLSEKDPKATVVTALLRLSRAASAADEGVQSLGENTYIWKSRGISESDSAVESS